MWYVAIPRLSGRKNFFELADKLQIRGFAERVEYSDGGWQDYMMHTVRPHLKFESEDDAIAYVLTFGGEISREIPIRLT